MANTRKLHYKDINATASTYTGDLGNIWFDPETNVLRTYTGSPGGKLIGDGTGAASTTGTFAAGTLAGSYYSLYNDGVGYDTYISSKNNDGEVGILSHESAFIKTSWNDADKTWTFGTDGTTTFPDGTTIGSAGFTAPLSTDFLINTFIDNTGDPGTKTWRFGTDGNLTIPNGGKLGFDLLADHTSGTIVLQSLGGVGTYAAIAGHWSYVMASDNEVRIQTGDGGNPYTAWTFGADGALSLPGDNTITDTKVTNWDTAYGWGDHSIAGYVTGTPWTSAGYLTAEADTLDSVTTRGNTTTNDITVGDLTVSGEIKTAASTGDVVVEANDGTARTWTFGGDGRTTFPATTVPATSMGAAGDKLGMVAFDDSYMYYCTADYVEAGGSRPAQADIWKRVSYNVGIWD